MSVRRRIVAGLGPFGLLFGCSPTPAPTPASHRATTGTTSPLHPLIAADEAIQPEPATTTTTEPPAPVTTVTVSKLPPTTRGTTTTVYVLPEAETEETDEEWWVAQGGPPIRAAVLACIRSYESGGDYGAVSPSGKYRGAYQFDRPTWASVGGSGDPAAAPAAEQDARAWALYQSRGLAPWPTPNARCAG